MAVACAVVPPGPVRVVRVSLAPVWYSSVLLSCRVLCLAGCVVCGAVCVSVVFVWWGILR